MKQTILFLCLFATVLAESVHWQWREMTCQPPKEEKEDQKDPAPCVLTLRETEFDTSGRKAPNTGCFEEVVNGTTRTYCNLGCPKADTVYMIKRLPQNHRSCFTQISYKVERRGQEWFLWREKKCRGSQVEFTIRCEFLFARADFPGDDVIFDHLNAPASNKFLK